MQRITITLEDDLLAALDEFMNRSNSRNRSEALREMLRRGLEHSTPDTADCVGIISYTLDLTKRDLSRKVPRSRHDHHDKTIAALSAPLDHDTAVEVAIMKGHTGPIRDYANSLFTERGVRHGHLSLVPVKHELQQHTHAEGHAHQHSHLKVLESFDHDDD